MITKEVIEAQRELYEQARKQAAQAIESAKADFAAFNGAIEACNSFLNLITHQEEYEKTQDVASESSEAEVVEVEPKK